MNRREFMPKPGKPVWLLFDMMNGHADSHRYVWWFETRKKATDFKLHRESLGTGIILSPPLKFLPASTSKPAT